MAVWRQDRLAGAGVGYADWTNHVSAVDQGSQLQGCTQA